MIIKYKKLVRDKIPEIIRADGKIPKTRILENDDEFSQEVDAKICEEAAELATAQTREEVLKELADLKQISLEKATSFKITEKEIEIERAARENSRGGFDKRIFLIEVDEGKK
ncbi:nucleoside triphosphate pyrophosphohydrolase [Candidatus Saccharibacteria bacterium]|nr:nucleoside triphosphate pyrophosphohydrolase [Candidatus Saccharibacteria bacterium]